MKCKKFIIVLLFCIPTLQAEIYTGTDSIDKKNTRPLNKLKIAQYSLNVLVGVAALAVGISLKMPKEPFRLSKKIIYEEHVMVFFFMPVH